MAVAGRRVLIAGERVSGFSIARVLADAGARVVLHSSAQDGNAAGNDPDRLEIWHGPFETVAQAEKLTAKCWESFGPIEGLVVIPEQAASERFGDTDEEWHAAMRSALELPFFLTRAVALRMAEADGGCIVFVINTGSNDALAINEVTSSGAITMSQTLAKALPHKVRICTVIGTDPTSGVAPTVRFLLGEDSLGSATIRLGGVGVESSS